MIDGYVVMVVDRIRMMDGCDGLRFDLDDT